MATWKKLLVSGSNISQLYNDAGYLTAGTAFNGFTTASINGVNLIADSTSDTLNFVTGSGTGLTIVGTPASDTITFTLAGVVSGSTFSSPSQGTVRATLNGVSQDVDTGLQIGDSPTFTNLTLTGDLTVQGTQTNINTTNLDVEDRYVLFNSGSSVIGDSGIVFGGANGVAQSGSAFIWDASYNGNDGRAAIVNNMASSATGDQTPDYHLAGVYSGSEAGAATAQADHLGNIRVEGGDIFIFA